MERAVVRGHRAPGEAERRHQDATALIGHGFIVPTRVIQTSLASIWSRL